MDSAIDIERSGRRRLAIGAALALGLLALVATRAAGPVPPVAAQAHPCRIGAGRAFDRSLLEQNQDLDVSVWMDLDCGGTAAVLDLVLLVDVQPLVGETPDLRHATALADGLGRTLERLDWANGSRVALIRVATAGHAVDIPLSANAAELTAALAALDGAGLDAAGDLGPAIDAAQALLAEAAAPGRQAAILLVDAGMPLQTNDQGAALAPPTPACQRATAAGSTVGVVSLPGAARRLANTCASPGHFEAVGGQDERKLDRALDQMGRVLAHPGSIVRAEYSDFIKSTFAYVERSGVPRDPDYIVLSEHAWQFEVDEQRFQQPLDYQVRVNPGFGEIITPVSVESKVVVEYADGVVEEHPLANPPLCIHWPGRQSYCLNWLRDTGSRVWLPRIVRP
ncbi:MAG: hypothetical protein H6648_03725 [Caldilineae bacterium]|nr:hypothetical protein [Caldilineae bacterium]